MYSLIKREIRSFFNSLTGYIVIILFLVTVSLFLWVFEGPMNLPDGGYATIDSLFMLAPWMFLMLIPAITMRSFSDEKKSGTLDLLLTRPLTAMQIIGAKYLASLVLIVLALCPTLIYYLSVIALGSPAGNIDHAGTWGSYTGLLMLAASYASVGIFCSSLTDNSVVSFILTAAICLFICYGFDQTGHLITAGNAGSFIVSLGIIDHYESMSRGVIDTRDVVYFAAMITVFLVMTRTAIEHKK